MSRPQPAGPEGRPWIKAEPGRIIGRGHPAGDFLQAWSWDVVEERTGYLRVEADLLDHLKNPWGQLFGGFTPTYVDLVSLFTVRAGAERAKLGAQHWLATTTMRIDYFEPIMGPRFVIESTLEKKRGRTNMVTTRFFQDGQLAVFASTTMREVALDRTIGDA